MVEGHRVGRVPARRAKGVAGDACRRSATALAGLGRAEEGVAVATPVPDLVASIASGRAIVRTLVPLLLAQLALLAVTVLALVANAAVEQRRPEVALARLRGRSREGGSRLVMAELAMTVLLGVPLGVGVALLVGDLVRRVVLPAGVPLELRWPLLAAVAVSVVACLVAVYLAARPVLREPVAALLRRVPPVTGRGPRGARRGRGRGGGGRPGRLVIGRRRGALGPAGAGAPGARRRAPRRRRAAPGGGSVWPPARSAGDAWPTAWLRSRSPGARRCGTCSSSSPPPRRSPPSPPTPSSSVRRTGRRGRELETGAPAVHRGGRDEPDGPRVGRRRPPAGAAGAGHPRRRPPAP